MLDIIRDYKDAPCIGWYIEGIHCDYGKQVLVVSLSETQWDGKSDAANLRHIALVWSGVRRVTWSNLALVRGAKLLGLIHSNLGFALDVGETSAIVINADQMRIADVLHDA